MSENNDGISVYWHIFPNGKRYIGISKNPYARWNNGNGYKTQGKIANAIRHYGWDNIKHEVVIRGLSKEQAEALEKLLIQAYDSIENGYNTAIGGDAINASYLNEHVLKMIRDSNHYDAVYGKQKKADDIVSLAEQAKSNEAMANVFNYFDGLIEDRYGEYELYHGKDALHDYGEARTDCYWWTMAQLISGKELHGERPYWEEWARQSGMI